MLQNNDFIEITFTAKLKENNIVFDTTEESVAKTNDIHRENGRYGPMVICIGQKQILPGLEKKLTGKELGTYTIELSPEEAFGIKDPKLVQLVSARKFFEHKIQPVPGLQVDFDGVIGTVKTASGGRCLVDFNHPLSGKTVVYEITVKRVVNDAKEKVQSLLDFQGLKEFTVESKENKLTVTLAHEFPQEIVDALKKQLKEIVKVDVEFKTKKTKEEISK